MKYAIAKKSGAVLALLLVGQTTLAASGDSMMLQSGRHMGGWFIALVRCCRMRVKRRLRTRYKSIQAYAWITAHWTRILSRKNGGLQN